MSIRGAREHNLKNINVDLPRDKLIVITGLSGSGKSTLAFDTLYAEGQRRYVESLSSYARQFLGLMSKPDVDSIEGLSPAISIEQKTTSKNPRSTVGTVTEIYDYLRLLYARIGTPHCPEHGLPIAAQSPQKIAERIAEDAEALAGKGTTNKGKVLRGKARQATGTIIIAAPIIRQVKGTHEKLVEKLGHDGYTKVRINGHWQRTDHDVTLERYKKHDILVGIDEVEPWDTERLTEAVEQAVSVGQGLVIVERDGKDTLYSSKMACPTCGITMEELSPRMFSFNAPFGACETCDGLGIRMDFDEELIIPDKSMSIADGAIMIYRNAIDGWRGKYLGAVAKHFGFDAFTPITKLTKRQYNALMHGSDEDIRFKLTMKGGDAEWKHTGTWEGLIPQSERLYHQTNSDYRKRELEKFMRISGCTACKGKRLKPAVLAVTVGGKSIAELTDLSIKEALLFLRKLSLTQQQQTIARQLLKEIDERLNFLSEVGLDYLTLSRAAGTLSGGEAQRIRLATQIGTNLMGVLYILDEPSIGLHQRDNRRLIATLEKLRDLGNTVIVVEHDEDTMLHADVLVDMGPGAGTHGGKIIAQGTAEEVMANKHSLTGQYLAGAQKIPVPQVRRKATGSLTISGCTEHNLKDVTAKIPTGVLVAITGVSGSGKSTLINDVLYQGMRKLLHNSNDPVGKHTSITFGQDIESVIVIDQSPIGRTPRSNPATYTKAFDEIRSLFANNREAKMRGYKPGRFSFNVPGGRCEACQGDGVLKIEMNFLPDVYVPCEECKGSRYNQETLQVRFQGHTIADVLAMSVDDASELFRNHRGIMRKLSLLQRVGLGYVTLGQSSTTLSGGEAQRIKLTRELAKSQSGRTLYLLDEPTTGLHMHDVGQLIAVLNDLVEKGNTVLVIEHNLDVVKSADWVIDLGPEGGDEGGRIIAEGTPEDIVKAKTYTGQYLARALNGGT
ncbi:excinuclease ABC subunit A [Candidatus Woesearchaeota archaeon CG1_02_57_44]|nr:MAG: excinuclease ABC subunit A [Candidatus Woesearchaeota archaeon CG1_02_57_44]